MSKGTTPHVSRRSSEWKVLHRSTDGAFRDRDRDRVGYGRTDGERSYNYRPVHADPVTADGTSDDEATRAAFAPFDAPEPERN